MAERRPDRRPHGAPPSGRQTASLAALAVILLLVIAGLWLVHALSNAANLQDCALSGHHVCDEGARR